MRQTSSLHVNQSRSRAERRVAQRVDTGQAARDHTDFAPWTLHGGLKRATREFAKDVSNGTENLRKRPSST